MYYLTFDLLHLYVSYQTKYTSIPLVATQLSVYISYESIYTMLSYLEDADLMIRFCSARLVEFSYF